MDDIVFGTEIEFASAGSLPPGQAARLVKSILFQDRRFGLIDPAPREWDEEPGNGGHLFNGARLYLDSGHIEYASAECRTLRDIIEQENAAAAVLLDTVESQEMNRKLFFIKNNTDHLGNTFGYHENYSIARSPRSRDLVLGLLPFLTTRQLYAGAGMTLNPAEAGGRLPFHMSQRAAFVSVDVSNRVRFGGRPIINLRDEPLSERTGLRRLHVVVGDANQSQYATALKIGTTALVAQLLAAGWNPDLYLDEAVRAIKSISRNPGGPWPVELVDGRTISAIDVQRIYLEAASAAFAGRDDDTDWTLAAWSECLDGLATDPECLVGKVDWVTKLCRAAGLRGRLAGGLGRPGPGEAGPGVSPRGPDREPVQRVAASRADHPAGFGTGEPAGNSRRNSRWRARPDRAGAVRGAGRIAHRLEGHPAQPGRAGELGEPTVSRVPVHRALARAGRIRGLVVRALPGGLGRDWRAGKHF